MFHIIYLYIQYIYIYNIIIYIIIYIYIHSKNIELGEVIQPSNPEEFPPFLRPHRRCCSLSPGLWSPERTRQESQRWSRSAGAASWGFLSHGGSPMVSWMVYLTWKIHIIHIKSILSPYIKIILIHIGWFFGVDPNSKRNAGSCWICVLGIWGQNDLVDFGITPKSGASRGMNN